MLDIIRYYKMPRLPTNYSRTIIYVIKCKDDNITEEYVGSTTDFIKRKCNHKSSCNNEKDNNYNQLKYKFIRENGGWDNWIMLEIEKYPCNDKRESEKREEEIRIERKAKLNSHKVYCYETKEEYFKKWREENKEDKKIKDKKYYEEHKEEHKIKCKIYYEEHKEELLEYSKLWSKKNREKISNRGKTQKWTCFICNKEMRKDGKSRHNKLIHQNF